MQDCEHRQLVPFAEVGRSLTAAADGASVAETPADWVVMHPREREQREEVVEEVFGVGLVPYNSLVRKGAVFDLALVPQPAKK
jgi:hypothetical protein